METEHLIQLETFCVTHNVAVSFISSLEEFGLVEVTKKEDIAYVPEGRIKMIEQLVRLHTDLNINVEGVEAITYLLEQLKNKEAEINLLKNRLQFYET